MFYIRVINEEKIAVYKSKVRKPLPLVYLLDMLTNIELFLFAEGIECHPRVAWQGEAAGEYVAPEWTALSFWTSGDHVQSEVDYLTCKFHGLVAKSYEMLLWLSKVGF